MSSHTDWKSYLASFPPRDPEFVKQGYAIGLLPREIAEELQNAILASKPVPISNDADPKALLQPLDDEQIRILNEQHVYRDFDSATSAAIAKALEHLKGKVARRLNSPWRVLNIRSWTTEKNADFGPNDWHSDCDLTEILKIMIYSSEVLDGAIEIMSGDEVTCIGGKAGTWVLFYNSVLMHRGLAPLKGIRVATEITIAPSSEFDLSPFTLGQVARRPLHP